MFTILGEISPESDNIDSISNYSINTAIWQIYGEKI